MTDVTIEEYAEQQLLGETATRVVGLRSRAATLKPGEMVFLEREPGNSHDGNAIQVVNQHDRHVGYVPRTVAAWLTPLIDAGKIRVEAYIPAPAGRDSDREGDGRTLPLALVVFLRPEGRHVLEPTEVRNAQDALHEIFRQAYRNAQSYTDADLILELAKGLRPLTEQPLLPESYLLLELMPGIAREVHVAQSFHTMIAFQQLLAGVTLGKAISHNGLSVFPLAWPETTDPPYVLLRDAIDRGEAEVTEINEHGSVPSLMLVNRGDRPILILEGEILVGVKQNRVVNITVLVAARSEFAVSVSCVEQGRWQSRSRTCRADFFAPSSLRRSKVRSVHANRAERGTSESNQGEVWDQVQACLSSLGVDSDTASLTDGLAAADDRLREYRENLPLPEDTAGVVVAHGDRILGMDLFDSPQTFAALWHRLGDGYFFEAMRGQDGRHEIQQTVVQQFLGRVAACTKRSTARVGLGDGLEILGDEVVGSGLLCSGKICHLSAFHDPSADDNLQLLPRQTRQL